MNKSLKNQITFLAVAAFLFLANYFGFKMTVADSVSFSIFSICLFHLIASAIAFGLFELCVRHLPSQAGIAFLALVFVKIGMFVMLFSSKIFTETPLNMAEKMVLIIPMFSFLGLEALWIAKSLKIFDNEIAQHALKAYPKESVKNAENDKN